MYEMKPEFYTNIAMIDEEHQQLFDYANEVYELLNNEFLYDKYDHILDTLGKLRDYAKKHFSDEETYMESIGYKRLFTQKIQHKQFVDKLDEIDLQEIEEGDEQDKVINDILVFITDWLVNHILEEDTRIGKYI